MKKIFLPGVFIGLALFVCFAATAAEDLTQKQFTPKKVDVDSNYDGKVDRIEYYDEKGQITRVEQDTTGSGKINEWIIYKNGVPVRKEKDTNGDGKPDVWIDY